MTIWPHVSCKCLACVQTSPISFVARGKQRKYETSARRQAIATPQFIPYSWGTRELLYTLVLASRVYLGYFDIQSLLCVAVKFRHGENFFLQIFIGFSWLCGTSFDVMMTVCWMPWRFYLFWSSLLCLWLCWQISVSLCIPLRDVGFLKNVTRGWLTTDIRRFLIKSGAF